MASNAGGGAPPLPLPLFPQPPPPPLLRLDALAFLSLYAAGELLPTVQQALSLGARVGGCGPRGWDVTLLVEGLYEHVHKEQNVAMRKQVQVPPPADCGTSGRDSSAPSRKWHCRLVPDSDFGKSGTGVPGIGWMGRGPSRGFREIRDVA